MKLAIMVAGEGSRMKPLTNTVPKPLLKVCWKTIIENNIEEIIDIFDEIFLIVKYKKEEFVKYFGENFKWKKINYIDQIESQGTGAAILSLKWYINWEFLVLSGDDIYDNNDIRKICEQSGYATLCKQVDRPEDFGIFQTDENWKAIELIEKPTDPKYGNLANIGIHKFDDKIFEDLEKIPLSPRWEIEITDLIDKYIKEWKYNVVEAKWRWITIGYPWDLLKANEQIIGEYSENINKWAIIEQNTSINGHFYAEEWVVIKSGTYIEWNVYIGKNAIIWPNAYIRWNTSIWQNSKIWAFVELKNSYIGENSAIPHLSYIGDSVIWNNVNLGWATKTANLRHDNANIQVLNKWKLVDSGRRKLWAIIADNVHTGINTLIYPGRTLDTNSTTLPGEIIK